MTGVIVSVAGIVLVAAFAVGASALLGVRGRAPFAVAVLVLGAADVVGSVIVLSPLHGVTRAGVLLVHAVVAAAVAGLWLTRGRPRPPRLVNRVVPVELGSLGVVSIVIAVAVLLVQLYVLARVAPSNWDSMTYHLSRAAYWLQYQSVGHYSGGSARQLYSAPNGEILVAWTMLLSGTDKWVEIIQWISFAGLGAAIFSGARMLRFGAPAAAFSAVVFMLLPQSLLQSTTTQNDLVVGFFMAATALFLARGLRDRHGGDLAIAGVALGLAVGTKTTALMAAPALGLLALVAWRGWRPERRVIARAGVALVLGVVAFGSYNYVLNAADTGDPFGGLQSSVSVKAKEHPGQNLARTMWGAFADTGGVKVPWLEPVAQRAARGLLASKAGRDYPFAVDTAVQEDTSGFGLVGFLVLPLLLLGALVRPRATPGERVLAVGAIAYLFLFGIRIDDNIWVARLMLPAVVLAAPLLGALGRRPWAAGFVLGLAVLSGLASLLENPAKPLVEPIGSPTVFSLSRLEQMTVVRAEMAPVFARLDTLVKPDAPLAVVAGEDSWDYPLFGEQRQRRVVRIDRPRDPRAAMTAEKVDGIVFLNVGPPPQGGRLDSLGEDAWLVRR